MDTHSVNISKEAHTVAALFHTVIHPISAGTPQELSFCETAHRVIGGTSRAMQANAPHMPDWCWGVRDQYAAYVLDFLPQSTRDDMCPFFLRMKKKPDWRRIMLHVYGAPVKYAPMGGPEHKQAPMTEHGYFAGVQWPMMLVLRKSDMKLISVSSKKCKVYESTYSLALDEDVPKEGLKLHEVSAEDCEVKDNEGDMQHSATEHPPANKRPRVQSTTSVSHHTVPLPGSEPIGEAKEIQSSAARYQDDPGEGEYVPEHATYSKDRLIKEIDEMTRRVRSEIPVPSVREKVIKKLAQTKDDIINADRDRGYLKAGKRVKAGSVSKENIVKEK